MLRGRPAFRGANVEAEVRALAPDLDVASAVAVVGGGTCYLVRGFEGTLWSTPTPSVPGWPSPPATRTSGATMTMLAWARSSRWNAMDIERDRYLFMSRTPGDEAHGPPPPTSILFRTMSAPPELDPAGHGLLWHSDPEIRVEDLLRRFSRLGPHRTLDESRSKRPLLCAIGRGPEGVVLRSREIAGGEDLDEDADFGEPVEDRG